MSGNRLFRPLSTYEDKTIHASTKKISSRNHDSRKSSRCFFGSLLIGVESKCTENLRETIENGKIRPVVASSDVNIDLSGKYIYFKCTVGNRTPFPRLLSLLILHLDGGYFVPPRVPHHGLDGCVAHPSQS